MVVRRYLGDIAIAAAIAYALYMLFSSFIADPQDVSFLSHKVGIARHLNHPVWIAVLHIHIAAAVVAIVSGMLNWTLTGAKHRCGVHRMVGYLYVLSVLGVDGTSGYLAPFATGGEISTVAFNTLNVYWLIVTVLAYVRIRRGDVAGHRAFMLRSYVFCDTNVLNRGFTYLGAHVVHLPYTTAYAIAVCVSIVVNVLVVEWWLFIQRRANRRLASRM
ncbi:putative membrane protein DUF2306 [Alicyclobacillus sacchari]|uniref:Putative membrane protein DUF2306 n=1 Tax=Alicyclobacillus sacchari TaxID=392010 RepID=A0A4R8LLU0_9BACL|nr:DUF2306 domain-containing protein [Alicyclobacillus sacchari]TDY46257.1 putative membrane protein DUF2306 [Alicyclobacillus sacchari]GMA57250.1 hypothetical protein GCM10025858_17530 [Alicyclobacillus sacchari]